MNLLTDVPLHQLIQKVSSKHNNAIINGKASELSNLTGFKMLHLVGDGLCAYTGREFSTLSNATFERINPELGYVEGNVCIVTQEANAQKGQLDSFVKGPVIPDTMKIKLLRKALYQLEKKSKGE